MADKTTAANGTEYDPNKLYVLQDKDGNKMYSKGDNGYVWEAYTNGVTVSVNDKGEWYVDPYLEVTKDNVVAHMPSWFRKTPEYAEWKRDYDPYITPNINADTFNKLNKILKGYGEAGVLRTSLNTQAETYGITRQDLKDNYRQTVINLYKEGESQENTPVTVYGAEYKNAAEFAREFKEQSKENASRIMTNLYGQVKDAKDRASKGEALSDDEQEAAYNALIYTQILNHVDDNYSKFGKDEEFKGLLEASNVQKFNAMVDASMGALSKSNVSLPARLFRGIAHLFSEGKFDTQIEKDVQKNLESPYDGYGLEGVEGWTKVGSYIGTAESLVAVIGEVMLTGKPRQALTDKMMASNSSFVQALGETGANFIGSVIINDFVLNDVPMDMLNFLTAWSTKGDIGKAFYDPEDSQPFLPIPFIGDKISPQVPTGLLMDIAGDFSLDVGLFMIGAGNRMVVDHLDDITNGSISRIKEWTAVKNLQIQQKLTDIPVVGTGWKKIMNHFMGAENAEYIRMARKQSIADGTMDPYIRAHNNLTLKNHGGAEAVIGSYKILKDKMGYNVDVSKFQKAAKNYGGMGKTQVEWSTTKGAKVKNFSRTVPDVLPKDVKQGLLDVERLAELKGQQLKNGSGLGGIIKDAATEKEIAELEAKIAKLPKEIRDFADRFSDLNKQVEALGVSLGITNEDWYKAMLLDPEFEKYMVRQTLVPVRDRVGSSESPAILNKGRKGYYSDNYIDPVISLDMKVDALGRAYAWNLQAEHIAAMQIAQGQVLAGKGGAEAAARMAEVKKEIAGVEATRKALGYDATLKKINQQAAGIEKAIREINTLLDAPEKISLKSVYNATTPPAITDFVEEFNKGTYKFGDGVVAKAGLSDSDAASLIKNTYSLRDVKGGGTIAAADNAKNAKAAASGKIYNEGITDDGRAFRYVINDDNVITELKEITDAPGLANTINRLGGVHKIDASTVDRIGVQNAQAINRTIIYYRDMMPNLPEGSTFRSRGGKDYEGTYGWIPGISDSAEYGYKIVNGHVEAENFPLYLGESFYGKGREKIAIDAMRGDEAVRWHPRNSVGLEQTPIHENGHATMARLCVLRVNEKIDAGKIKVTEGMSSTEIGRIMRKEWDELNETLVKRAFEKLGISYTSERDFQKQWQQASYDNISHYAGYIDMGRPVYQWETFSEAMVDLWANSDSASKFTLAIVDEMRLESVRFTKAASPKSVLVANGLPATDVLVNKSGQWNFPKTAKTPKQKANWLAKQRKLNPYLDPDFGPKGKIFTTDEYIKANLWDTFLKKEISAYDANVKTSIPDALVAKNGDFQEDLSKNTAKKLVEKVKEASVNGFDENLAMIALGRNVSDTAEAMDNFIISQINTNAEEIAKKMPGGATAENLDKARLTLWQDDNVKSDMAKILSALAPDVTITDINSKIDTIFKEQATGLASVDPLSVSYGTLNKEYKELVVKLYESNKYAIGKGKEMDKKLAKAGFIDDSTQTIHYVKGGEDVYVVVKDPVTASILRNPGDYAKNGILPSTLTEAANTIARRYRLGTTGMSIPALVRNVLRDPIQAWKTAGSNPLTMSIDPSNFYSTLRHFGLDDATIKDVTLRIRDWASTGTLSSELKQAGGGTPTSLGYSQSKSERFIKWYNDKVLDGKIYNAAGQPLEMWESFFRNQVGQQSFIKAMRSNGGDIDRAIARAMFDTSNATTNFSHSVYFLRRLTGSIPYLSSGINSVASFWRLFNIDPIGMIGRITAGFMVPTMAITAWNLVDEERRKVYLNLPEWFRASHAVLVDLDGNVFAVPMPDEIGNYFNTARLFIEYTQEATPASLPAIFANGAFGFLPGDSDGFIGDDGHIDIQKGFKQALLGLIPQAITAGYETWAEYNTFSDYSTSDFEWYNKLIYNLGNVFGSSFINIANDIGFICGASSDFIYGKNTAEVLARDLFGIGFNNAKQQFMELIGNPSSIDPKTKKETKATGLFKESEEIQKQLKAYDKKIAQASEDEKQTLQEERQKLVDDFGERVKNMVNKYMQLYTTVGGLEEWQRKKIIQILSLGESISSAEEGSYQSAASSEAGLDEYGLGRQRYVDLGLPSGPTMESLAENEKGNLNKSIELQAAIDSYYGSPKQATQDYKNAIESAGVKEIRNEFYEAIQKIYDIADEQGIAPDYDMIERIQARYLQAVDAAIAPIINQYGLSILNNNDFIDAVRRQVNGMIPSDDWRQSRRNAKKFLSTKDFPTATVDVKKWLTERYTTAMRDRGLDSDAEVIQRLDDIKAKIDRGEKGAAKGAIEDLRNGINKAQYYISSKDYETLAKYYNMVK